MEDQTGINPLAQYYRQPKIYIRLPSNGEFYPEGSLDVSQNQEYAVYSMTARDELLLKTPDALLNGQSTVDVIKSCVPAIVDPWKMPVIDVDAVLMAIRIATYGNDMDVTSTCPGCEKESDYTIDLTEALGNIQNGYFQTEINFDPLIISIAPYTYKDMTTVALQTFEQQRVLQIVSNDDLSEAEKLEKFNESFNTLTKFTVDTIASSISSIQTPDGIVSNKDTIRDFINNTSREVFDVIQQHVNDIKEKSTLPPQKVQCTDCETTHDVAVAMDMANFFAVGS